MWGEIKDWVFSEENRKERMLLADRRNILEIWSKMFSHLERHVWRNTLAIWRKHVRRFGENVFGENVGDLEKRGRRSYGDFVLEFVME